MDTRAGACTRVRACVGVWVCRSPLAQLAPWLLSQNQEVFGGFTALRAPARSPKSRGKVVMCQAGCHRPPSHAPSALGAGIPCSLLFTCHVMVWLPVKPVAPGRVLPFPPVPVLVGGLSPATRPMPARCSPGTGAGCRSLLQCRMQFVSLDKLEYF